MLLRLEDALFIWCMRVYDLVHSTCMENISFVHFFLKFKLPLEASLFNLTYNRFEYVLTLMIYAVNYCQNCFCTAVCQKHKDVSEVYVSGQ